jgi:transcription antitermination factor NusA-like protein
MEKKFPTLQNIHFYKTVEYERTLAIILGKGDLSNILGQGGRIIKTIGTKVGKNIRVLEHGVPDRKFLEDLVAPMNIVTINTIWLPDGTTETKVILKKSSRKRSQLNIMEIKEIAKKVRNMTLRIEFT